MNLFEEIQRQKQLMKINEGFFGRRKKTDQPPEETSQDIPKPEPSNFERFLQNLPEDNYGLPIMFSVLSHGFTSNNKYGSPKTNYYSFDPRSNYEIMNLISHREPFIKIMDRKGKTYKIVGVALDQSNKDVEDYAHYQRWVGGREGYAFAIIENSPEVIDYITQKTGNSNIDQILIDEAVKSIKHYFTAIRNWDGAIKIPTE